MHPIEPLRTTRDRRVARHWATALSARRVAYDVEKSGRTWAFYVPDFERSRASAELAELDDENREWPPAVDTPDLLADGTIGGLLWFSLCAFFYAVQHLGWLGLAWTSSGRVDATGIREGEWWRAMTALSLHVDLVHVAGNALFGALFFALVCQVLGTPLAVVTVLVSGTLGNLANAYIQAPPFYSVGASTAVFGAVGILCAHGWQRRARFTQDRLRRWLPLLVGLVFLAYLGVPDPNASSIGDGQVDVLAHVTGFAAGVVLGGLLGRLVPRLALGRGNLALAAAAPAVFAGAWWLALRN